MKEVLTGGGHSAATVIPAAIGRPYTGARRVLIRVAYIRKY